MDSEIRRADKMGRIRLFQDFADHLVIVKRISDDEVRVIKAKAVPKRYALSELVEQIKPDNLHDEIDAGRSTGEEKC